ncbi:MAG: hypothetical protein WCG93_14780, partial [Paludibacter sp.]
YIPSLYRKEFLVRTSQSLHKSGWLLIERRLSTEDLLSDFDYAYERTNRVDFGSFYAIRYSPRVNYEMVSTY